MENIFGIYKKYWANKAPEGGHLPSTRVEGAPYPLGAPSILVGPVVGPLRPSSAIWCVFTWKKSEGSFRYKEPLSRGGTWAEPI